MTHEGLLAVVQQIRFPGWQIELRAKSDVPYLQIKCAESICNVTGDSCSWSGRKWMLSYHMTAGEVVQTAFKAVLTALEHEAREQFTYKGVAVLDPHYDIEKLVELRSRPDALQERLTHLF